MAKTNPDKSASTYEVLTSKGYKPETALFNVDGYIITQGLKCDKLVWVNMNRENENKKECDIFVELKGKDVAHAIEQIRATLKNPYFKYSADKTVKARIVVASFPANKSNPIMEKAKREFAASPYHCELRGMKNGQKDKI